MTVEDLINALMECDPKLKVLNEKSRPIGGIISDDREDFIKIIPR